MRILLLAAGVLIASSAAAPGAPSEPSEEAQEMRTENVLGRLHAIDRMEMELGRLAQARARSAQVRRYGTLLLRDHRYADRRVLAFADEEGIELSEPPMEAADRKMINELEAAKGSDFDQAFLAAMKAGHNQAVALLSKALAQTQNAGLRHLVARLIPILQQHEALAQDLQRPT